jgi:hypothetical protein
MANLAERENIFAVTNAANVLLPLGEGSLGLRCRALRLALALIQRDLPGSNRAYLRALRW